MKSMAKVAGKKQEWTEASPEVLQEWKFEKRPGGWVIGVHTQDGKIIERRRFYFSRRRQNFFAKFTSGPSLDFFGERIQTPRGSQASDSASDYTAQFPGKVRKILVEAGDEVEAGIPLIMVEAMKMEFAIRSGTAGVVKKVWVEEGTILTPGQRLLDFEEAKSPA